MQRHLSFLLISVLSQKLWASEIENLNSCIESFKANNFEDILYVDNTKVGDIANQKQQLNP